MIKNITLKIHDNCIGAEFLTANGETVVIIDRKPEEDYPLVGVVKISKNPINDGVLRFRHNGRCVLEQYNIVDFVSSKRMPERQITRGVYRTRGGNVAIVFGVNGVDELYPAVGVLVSKDSDNAHSPTQWTADGVFIKGSESVNDITTRICDIEEYPITPSKVDSFSDKTDEQKTGEVKEGRYKMRNGCIAVVTGYGYNPEKPIVGHIESSESPKGNILEWTRGGMFRTDGVPCGKDLLKRVERVAVDPAAKTDIPRLYFITRRVDDVKQKTVVVRGGKYITRNGLVATVERVSLEDSTNYPLFGQTVGALGVAFESQWNEHGKSNVHEKFDLVAHMDDLPDAIIELAVRGFTRGARSGCVR